MDVTLGAETTRCFAEKRDVRKTGCFQTRMFFWQLQNKILQKARGQSESNTDSQRVGL